MKNWIAGCLSVVAFALVAPGCGDDDPIDEVNQIVDCAEICDRFEECKDSSVDVTACSDDCEELISNSEALEDDASTCEDCLDGRSCEEAETAGCWNDCPVVPVQD